MKPLLTLLVISLLCSCASTTFTPAAETVKAKLKVDDIDHSSTIHYEDILIGNVDPMYVVGDHIRYRGRDCVILAIEERPFKHIVYPEEIRLVSTNPDSSTVLECYQHNDTLELRFKNR